MYEIIKLLFLQYSIITIPVFSIILVIIYKAVTYQGEFDTAKVKELFNIGLDLSTSGVLVLLTNISIKAQSILTAGNVASNTETIFIHSIMVAVYLMLVLLHSLAIRFFGWDKVKGSMKDSWIIISNVIGLGLLILTVVFIGGN